MEFSNKCFLIKKFKFTNLLQKNKNILIKYWIKKIQKQKYYNKKQIKQENQWKNLKKKKNNKEKNKQNLKNSKKYIIKIVKYYFNIKLGNLMNYKVK